MQTSSSRADKRIAVVDLTTRQVLPRPSDDLAERFLGGRGIDQWLLYERADRHASALAPGQPLVFGAGPLCGTLAPAAARVSVVAKNYATGGLGFSNAGGGFGPAMRFAGFDHLVIIGCADRPVYLDVTDGAITVEDASDLWGASTWDVDRSLRERLGPHVEVASIGIAGERAVRAACIIFGRSRAAAHCGLGAVMGSKNLKAVAVRGTGSVSVARPDELMALVDQARDRLASSQVIVSHQEIGTLCYPEPMNDLCMVNVRNWADDHWDPARLKALIEPYKGGWERQKLACTACPVFCSHFFEKVPANRSRAGIEGFEANAPLMFGPALDIDHAPFVLRAHALCSQHGLDIDAAGSVIAFAFDCYERGLLTPADTDGLELRWGDWRAAELVLEKLAHREGLGDLLAEGSPRAARQIGQGAELLVGHLKGEEHFEALRAAPGWALGTAVALRGGGHLDGAPGTEFGEPWDASACDAVFGLPSGCDPSVYEGKARIVSYFEKLKAVTDCLGLCYFTTQWYDPVLLGPLDLARLLHAVTDVELDPLELLEIGDRVHNVGKAFNTLHAGFGRGDDYPAQRFFKEPIESGVRAGTRIDRGRWNDLLDEYYEEKGWNVTAGRQGPERLAELGLEDVATDLAAAGLLS